MKLMKRGGDEESEATLLAGKSVVACSNSSTLYDSTYCSSRSTVRRCGRARWRSSSSRKVFTGLVLTHPGHPLLSVRCAFH